MSSVSAGTTTVTGLVHTSDTTGDLVLKTGASATTAMTISGTDQSVAPAKLLDLSGAAAGQIKFPATQNASADANTLDDYEEGTWTPADNSGASLSIAANYAKYTKVGRQVTLNAQISYPATGSGASASMSGMPFAPANNSIAVLASDQGTLTLAVFTTGGTSVLTVLNAITTGAVTNTNLSGKTLYLSMTYFV